MDALPYYKWLWIDYRANRKVQRMPWQARGLYRELLDEFWSEGSLPNDTAALAEVCGCTKEEFEQYWPLIRPCFTEEDGILINAKMDEQRTATDKKRTANARNGRAGAIAKLANASERQTPSSEGHIAEQSMSRAEHEQEHEQSRVVAPPKENIASLVSKIAVAFPKSRLVALTEADVRPEQRVSIIQAVDAEVERVGVTRTQAAQMILDRLELLVSAVPSSEWKFFQKLPEFMRDRQYRLDPEVFTSGSNQQNQVGRVSPATERKAHADQTTKNILARRYGIDVDGAHAASGGSVSGSGDRGSNQGDVPGGVGGDGGQVRPPHSAGRVIEGDRGEQILPRAG